MDQDPLVKEQIDAGANFLGDFDKKIHVLAAFWLKAREEDRWYLYVTSDQFEKGALKASYLEVLRIVGAMRDPNFGPLQVKLIEPDEPLAKAALQFLQLYTIRTPTRLRDRNIGGISFEEMYLYPTPIPVS